MYPPPSRATLIRMRNAQMREITVVNPKERNTYHSVACFFFSVIRTFRNVIHFSDIVRFFGSFSFSLQAVVATEIVEAVGRR